MAKKITLSLLIMLVITAFVFVSCNQDTAGSGGGGKPSGKAKIELDIRDAITENVFDDHVETLDLYNMNFEQGLGSDYDTDLQFDAAKGTIVADLGVGGSKAMDVVTSDNYGTTIVDITDYYGLGKSYYVEASIKNNGSTNTKGLVAYVSYTVCSGTVKDYVDAEYDCDDIYGAPFMEEEEALNLFGADYPTRGTQVGIELKDDYITLSGIIPATEIDEMIINQTKEYAESYDDEPTLDYLYVCFYVGEYPDQNGRHFLIDNIVIKDLNADMETTGKTHKAKSSEENQEQQSTETP